MNKNKNTFNMVEITLAIAVIGIGVAGVMSLFPVALNASRDAIGNNYAPDIADQFLTYITMQCNSDWTTIVSGLHTSKPDDNGSTELTNSDAGDTWYNVDSATASTNIYVDSGGTPTAGLYRIYQGGKQENSVPANTVCDFAAAIRVWKTSITDFYIAGASVNFDDLGANKYKYGFKLNLELSWPVAKPYAYREKRYYSLEVFNANP